MDEFENQVERDKLWILSQVDREVLRATHINRGTSSWNKKCKECGNWFVRDRHTYDYEVCPECLERTRAQRDAPKTEEQLRAWQLAREKAEIERAKADWTHSILEFCNVCNNSYKAPLTDPPQPRICPRCQEREKDNAAGNA